jgi:Peptidase inhibitor I78 family
MPRGRCFNHRDRPQEIRMPAFRLTTALALSLLLGACAPTPDEQEIAVTQSEQRAEAAAQPAPPEPVVPAGSCDDSQAQWAIGKTVGEADVEQARKDSTAKTARTLKPGQVVTMEFNADRLNLDLDDTGAVTAVRCG